MLPAGPSGCRSAQATNSWPKRLVALPAPCAQGFLLDGSVCAATRDSQRTSAWQCHHAPAASAPTQALTVQLQGLYEISPDEDACMPALPPRQLDDELHVQAPVHVQPSDINHHQNHTSDLLAQHQASLLAQHPAIQPDAATWLHQQGFNTGWQEQIHHHPHSVHTQHLHLQHIHSTENGVQQPHNQPPLDHVQQHTGNPLHVATDASTRRRRKHQRSRVPGNQGEPDMSNGADTNGRFWGSQAQHGEAQQQRQLDPERQLTVDLQQCDSFPQVLEVLHRYASQYGRHDSWQLQQANGDQPMVLLQSLNPRHLAVLWCTLGRVGGDLYPTSSNSIQRDALRSLVRKLEEMSIRCMMEVTPDGHCPWRVPDAVGAMWAMGHLKGHEPSRRWMATWIAFTQPHLQSMWARHLAKALWGLAATGAQLPNSWLEPAIARIVHVATRSYTRLKLTVPGYASVLWSISRLAVKTHASARTQQGGLIEAAQPPLTADQLSQYLHRAVRYLRCMEPQHVSMMVWSLGHLAAVQHPALHGYLTMSHNLQQQQQLVVSSNVSNQHQQQQQGGSDASPDNAPPSNTPAAAAAVAQQLNSSIDQLWAEVSMLGAQRLGPQGTANTLWAAARLGVRLPSPATAASASGTTTAAQLAAQQLVQECTPMLRCMSPQQLYNCAWAMATMQVTPSQACVHSLLSASRPQLTRFDVQSLVGLLWACCKLRIKPGPAWMSAAMRVIDTQAQADKLCAASLPVLLWSLAQLGYQPGLAWTKALTARTWRLLPHMQPQGLAMCVHALAKLQLPPHPTWCKAFRMCLEQSVSVTAAAAVKAPVSQRPWPGEVGNSEEDVGWEDSAELRELQRQVAQWRPLLPEELSSCLQGMARLGIQPTPGLLAAGEQLLGSWVQQHRAGESALGTRQLSGCLYGLVRLNHATASVSFLADCAGVCIAMADMPSIAASQEQSSSSSNMSQLKCVATDVAQATWALAMLGHTPTQHQLASLTSVLQQLLPYMGHAELAQCVWAVQRMGLSDPEPAWVETLLQASERQMRQLLQQYHVPASMQTPQLAAPCRAVFIQPQDSMDGTAVLQPAGSSISGSPLLSVATLVRAVAQWNSTPFITDLSPSNASGSYDDAAAVTATAIRQQARVKVRRSWLEAAMLIVEVEAQRRPATAEGELPNAAQLSASPLYEEAITPRMTPVQLVLPEQEAEPLPHAASITAHHNGTPAHTSSSAASAVQQPSMAHGVRELPVHRPCVLSPAPLPPSAQRKAPSHPDGALTPGCSETHAALSPVATAPATTPGCSTTQAAPAPSAGWSELPAAPYTLQQDRIKALSASEANSRKKARRRLWRSHRMHVLQHHKVVQASRRAIQQLLATCSTSSMDDNGASADGSDCSTQPLLNGQDARFIPW